MFSLPSRAQIAHVGCMANTGISVVAFSALNITTPNGSAPLNCAVNWITGGRINRDTLAQTVVRNSLFLGLSSQFAEKDLSDRSAHLAQLTSKIFFDNTADEIHASIKDLTQELLNSETEYKPGIKWAAENLKRQFLEVGITTIAELTANAVIEPNFIEKLVATNISLHGKKPLQEFMEKALSALPIIGTKFIANLVTDILQRAIVNKPEFNQSERPIFQFLAAETNELLTEKKNYKKPIADYCAEMSVSNAKGELQKTALRIAHKYFADDENFIEPLANYCKEMSTSDKKGDIEKTLLATIYKFLVDKKNLSQPTVEYLNTHLANYASNTKNTITKSLLIYIKESLNSALNDENQLVEYNNSALQNSSHDSFGKQLAFTTLDSFIFLGKEAKVVKENLVNEAYVKAGLKSISALTRAGFMVTKDILSLVLLKNANNSADKNKKTFSQEPSTQTDTSFSTFIHPTLMQAAVLLPIILLANELMSARTDTSDVNQTLTNISIVLTLYQTIYHLCNFHFASQNSTTQTQLPQQHSKKTELAGLLEYKT